MFVRIYKTWPARLKLAFSTLYLFLNTAFFIKKKLSPQTGSDRDVPGDNEVHGGLPHKENVARIRADGSDLRGSTSVRLAER